AEDLVDLQSGVVEDRGFHLSRDHGVIDVLSGPLPRRRRPAPPGQRQGDSEDKDPEPYHWSHVQPSIPEMYPQTCTSAFPLAPNHSTTLATPPRSRSIHAFTAWVGTITEARP